MPKQIYSFIVSSLLITTFLPLVAFGNGGDQRVVENTYFISLSRAPFTPRVGVETSFLASFVDIQKDKLISEDVVARVRIAKVGEKTYIFDKENISVQGGVMDFKYTFAEKGMHHLFVDFTLATAPEKVYDVPDFLIDVQKSETNNAIDAESLVLGISLGVVVGLLGGWFVSRRKV